MDIRRRKLHELETERLGLTEVCRYDTRVVTEDEETGPQGIETNERQPANGDGSNPILVDDEPNAESLDQTVVDPLQDLEPSMLTGQLSAADHIAPIVELLRKRQREEREESDIRREEQILLNKRLAMMEGQVQMLSKLITQRNLQPASPSLAVDVAMNKSADAPAEPDAEAETAATSGAVNNTIAIDDEPAENTLEERTDALLGSGTTARPTDADTDRLNADELADVVSDERAGTSLESRASTGPEHADVDERISTHEAMDAVTGAMDEDQATRTTETTEDLRLSQCLISSLDLYSGHEFSA